jgi:hypothetical protein
VTRKAEKRSVEVRWDIVYTSLRVKHADLKVEKVSGVWKMTYRIESNKEEAVKR